MASTSEMDNHPHSTSARTFTSLPTEIHLLIASNLTYPDALSLKQTDRYFYDLVYTGVNLKIEWLIERRRLHLDCPHDKGCELGSDMRFCRGSVRLLMKRRREHGECESRPDGRGCLVFGTKICTYQQKAVGKMSMFQWFSWGVLGRVGTFLWWISLALLGAAAAWVWMNHQRPREVISTTGGVSLLG